MFSSQQYDKKCPLLTSYHKKCLPLTSYDKKCPLPSSMVKNVLSSAVMIKNVFFSPVTTWNHVTSCTDVEEAYDIFMEEFSQIYDAESPEKTNKKKNIIKSGLLKSSKRKQEL